MLLRVTGVTKWESTEFLLRRASVLRPLPDLGGRAMKYFYYSIFFGEAPAISNPPSSNPSCSLSPACPSQCMHKPFFPFRRPQLPSPAPGLAHLIPLAAVFLSLRCATAKPTKSSLVLGGDCILPSLPRARASFGLQGDLSTSPRTEAIVPQQNCAVLVITNSYILYFLRKTSQNHQVVL